MASLVLLGFSLKCGGGEGEGLRAVSEGGWVKDRQAGVGAWGGLHA